MASIADSDAVHDLRLILPQHQAAVTQLNARLQNPNVEDFQWLDLACGKGQIISQLEENLSPVNRKKLSYTGYDINEEHTRIAERIADQLALKDYTFLHGDLSNFTKLLDGQVQFNFITCTNTAHELQPDAFTSIIIDSLLRLTDKGELFLYDMESLEKPELGALPWRAADIRKLLNTIFEELESDFRIHPSTWIHKSCKGWTVTIQREYVAKSDSEIRDKREQISKRLESEIDEIIDARLVECNRQLQSYCRFRAETADDATAKISALYEFWALHHAKEARS